MPEVTRLIKGNSYFQFHGLPTKSYLRRERIGGKYRWRRVAEFNGVSREGGLLLSFSVRVVCHLRGWGVHAILRLWEMLCVTVGTRKFARVPAGVERVGNKRALEF